jgi:hypothetical protein
MSGGGATLPFFGGAGIVSLPPEVPADMLGALLDGWLGALLGGRVDGVLWPPQSLSDAVGDDADDVLEPFLSIEVVDERAEVSFCRVPRVWPGCLSYVPASGGGRGTVGFECNRSIVLGALGGAGCIVDPEMLRAAFNWFDRLVFPCGGLSGPSLPSLSARVVSSEESSIVMAVIDFLIKR